MTYVKCSNCGEIIDVPDELIGEEDYPGGYPLATPYLCDACETPEATPIEIVPVDEVEAGIGLKRKTLDELYHR